ncbi:unnamed protein product [Schistosoma haematobium]|nr:unnamed protein product [Schistosoma haematobium]
MSLNLYEASRIKNRADERDHIQKCLFTNWINAQLDGVFSSEFLTYLSYPNDLHNSWAYHNSSMNRLPHSPSWEVSPSTHRSYAIGHTYLVKELYHDLRDGRILLRLLELLSGRQFTRINHSRMRIHQLENINKALDFLYEEGAHLENVGAQDIVDGNPRITLGLIWTIILHYQVQDIVVKESDETGEVRHARDALLLWCQLKTAGYPQVEVVDFTKSWRDSLAFAALLHRHYPDLIDYERIRHIDSLQVRLEIIFQRAYLHLGIPILIESKDFTQTCWLEERCVMTVVATWYRYLTSSHNTKLSSERVSKVIQHSLIISHKIFDYIKQAKRWLKWSNVNINQINQLLIKLQESNQIRNELDVKQELQNLMIWRRKEKAEKMSELVQLETLLTEIHTSQLAESHRLFKPPNGFSLNDLEESWKCLITVEHNCHLAIVDELIRRENVSLLGIKYERKVELCLNWLQENIQIINLATQTEDMKLLEQMNLFKVYLIHLTTTTTHEHSQVCQPFPLHHLIITRQQITLSQQKHSAFMNDIEMYIHLKLYKLNELLQRLTISSMPQLQWDKYQNQWNHLLIINNQLQMKLYHRENDLKFYQEWLDYCLQFNNQFEIINNQFKQFNQLIKENQIHLVNTYLDQLQIDINQLVIWIESVKTLLNRIDHSEVKQFDDDNNHQSRSYLQINIRHSLESIQLYHSNLEKILLDISQWNTTIKNVYGLLNEMNEELLWIKDQNDSIKPLEILKEELVENFGQVGVQTHHLQSRLHLLNKELQLRYGINYYNHHLTSSNQTLYEALQQISTKLNPINFNQLTMNDISLMSILNNIHLDEYNSNEIEEYHGNEIIGDLKKCSLIRIYEDIILSLGNMHLSNFPLDNSTCTNDQNIQHEERCAKVVEFVKLLQRQWSKLLIAINDINVKLARHHQYLNGLYSLVILNTKIEEINLRICETYNGVQLTSTLADCCLEPVRDKSTQNEVIDMHKTGMKSTTITNTLKEQKAITINKEIVINSTLRQMDHIIEQLKLFTTHLNQLRNEVYAFLPARSILNENDYSVFHLLKTKLNHLYRSRKSLVEVTFQSVKQQNTNNEDNYSSDRSDEVSLTGLRTVGSSFQEDIDSVISKSSLEDDKEEKIDKNQLPTTTALHETLDLQQTDCEMTLATTESENSLQGIMFKSTKSIISSTEGNEDNKYSEHNYRTPMNSPEEHELHILLLPHVSMIAHHLLNRLSFIHMHFIDCLENSLKIRDKLELRRDVLRLVDNIVSMGNWIEEKERILLTFNPIIYPSMEFLNTLPIPCPITVTEEIIHSLSQLSIQAYRFKTFEHELISHANLRLSEIGMLNEGLSENLKKLDKERDFSILQFIQSTIKLNLSIEDYVDDDEDDVDDDDNEEAQEEEDSSESRDKPYEISVDKESSQEFVETNHETKMFYRRISKNVSDEQTDDNNVDKPKYSKLLDYINKKWQRLKLLLNARRERFELAAYLSKYHTLCQTTKEWIIRKRELLISTDDLGTDLNSVMQLQRRLLGWEKDFIALQDEIQSLNVEGERLLKALVEEAPQRRDLYLISGELYASKEVNHLRLELNHEWELLQVELKSRQDKLLASAELQQFFQGLDDNQLWLRNIEIRVATHQVPLSVEEAKAEIDIHKELGEEILARKDEYSDLISYGRCITAGETDLHYIQLDERLDRLENGWSELMQMWTYEQKLLQQNLNFQMFLRDAHLFETLLSTQESKLMNYQLIKQKNTTDIVASLKSQNEIVQCLINANESLNHLCDTGNQLIIDKVYSMEKIQNKICFIKNRYITLLDEARTLVDSTKDLIALREDMQQIQTLQEWLIEKKELVEEYDQAGKLSNMSSLVPYKVFVSKQYTQHRVLESEIESNNDRIEQVFQNVINTIVQYPRIADQLSESLGNLMILWETLRKLIRERGDYMVQLHRAIIFEDGYNELNRWLDKFFIEFLSFKSFDQLKQFEEHAEQDPSIMVESFIEQFTSEYNQNMKMIEGTTESSSNIMEYLIENKFMNQNWTNKANIPGCTSMNEVSSYLNKMIECLINIDVKKKLLVELHEHSKILSNLDNQNQNTEVKLKMQSLIKKFWKIQIFVYEHAEELKAQKHIYQLYRDLENERIWTHEKLLLADNTYIGRSLFAVNQLIRQHQLLIKEVANRTNRMEITIQDADNIITKFQSTFEIVIDDDCKTIQQSKIRSSEKTMTIQIDDHSIIEIELSTDIGVKYKIPKKILMDLHTLVIELRYDLKNLIDRMSKRTERLNIGFQCFTHLDEFAELRSWLQECEDMLLLESRASRDIITAKTELKKHAHIEFRVNTLLANCVRDFNQKSLKLINEFLERKEKYKNQLDLIKTNENLQKVVEQLSGIQVEKRTTHSQWSQSILHDENMNKVKQSSFENLINRRKLRSQIKQLRKRIQVIQSIQRIMDRQYASLLDVCVQKRQRLEEILSLSIVYEEVSELKNWLNQQITIASSTYTGRSLNECVCIINRFIHFGENLLGESFTSFVEVELHSFDPISTVYTINITDQFVHTSGLASERTARVMNMCRCLIRTKHSDSPRIAFWQDIISETWADLRELICSRVKLLISAAHRFIFIIRCSETLKLVQEKSDQLSQSIGKDIEAICKQLSLLSAFEQDVQALEPLINWVEKAADYLLPLYSGNWIKRLKKPRDILLSVWYQLKDKTHLRRIRLKRSIALYRWISNLDAFFNWTQQCQKELERIEMDIWNMNPPQSTVIKKSNHITTENIKFAIGQALQLRAELNARNDKVNSYLEEGKRLKASFKQHLMQYDKSRYEKCHQPYEMSQLYSKTEMGKQHGTNNPADEIQICKISEQQKKFRNNTLQNVNITDKHCIIEKSEQHSRIATVRSISSDPHLESVRLNANYSQKSDSSSLALNQMDLQNESHMSDEEDQIIKDLQLRMTQVVTSWYNLHKKWHQIYERLELQLSINEFASVADSLEHWLVLHSAEVECLDMGDSIKETQILIDRLNVLERNTLPQISRYEKVKQLTKFELAEIEENMLNVPISCVNIVHSSDLENIQTLLNYYELNETDASNDLDDSRQNVDTMTDENVKDTTDSPEVSWEVAEDSISDYLMRKHEWINHNCKSRDRSWYELYMVLNTSVKQLLAYKNKSDYNEDNPQSNTFRGETGLLVGQNLLTACETKDYTKRSNTFRITSTATGARYLFQAQTSEIMRKWLGLIQNINRQTRSTSGPTLITLSRPSEEFQNPLVIVDIHETLTTSKKLTLTQMLRSKTTNQISCMRRHSSTQDNDLTNNILENTESPQIRMKRFPSVRTMKVFSPRQVVRWLTFKYSSFSPSSSSSMSHQTPKLIRSSTSHNMESEQSSQPTPVLRKSLTYGSLHKISRFSITPKSHKDT